mmetsp:Transcript_23944/g.26727  ORF Transcript_23944/g.26727 Transcript_23944/m.26727 type:complete len:411 (-) Transcript_23944:159-1391(-)
MRSFYSQIFGFHLRYIVIVSLVIGGCLLSASPTAKAFSVGDGYCHRHSTGLFRIKRSAILLGGGKRSAGVGTIQKMVVECGATSSVVDGDDYSHKQHENNEQTNSDTIRYKMIWGRLLEWFQGDFDNYAQVFEDRKNGLLPRDGGGHEHFHCTLIPVTESSRLAAFFFDGNPNRIFRFRYYELLTPTIKCDNTIDGEDHQHNNVTVEMRLNVLNPDLEKILKSHATDPLCWPDMFKEFQQEPKVIPLSKCEITWSVDRDPIQHSYLLDIPDEDEKDEYNKSSLHAVMTHGVQVVNSTIVPGMQIRILDQLSLYQDVFYINDRGFDPITGAFIYGNQRGIPYRLERVSNILCDDDEGSSTTCITGRHQTLKLQVINPDLEWTLGPNYRTMEEYDCKLKVIDGPSTGISNKN